MSEINLKHLSTRAPEEFSKENTKQQLEEHIEKLDDLQNRLYASKKYSLLIILQGMDASGKDGAVKSVFSSVNPQGVKVKSFKAPTEEEQSHDFLWRIHRHAPALGMIQIFNRSHYEDVLVPQMAGKLSREEVLKRYQHINNFESLLTDSHTRILKFYLHLSPQEQLERLEERLHIPKKKWKYSLADHHAAAQYDDFLPVYEDIFRHCQQVPWQIIPTDQNWYKEYLIAKAIYEELKSLNLKYPEAQKE